MPTAKLPPVARVTKKIGFAALDARLTVLNVADHSAQQ
jgi:hypothetical protein